MAFSREFPIRRFVALLLLQLSPVAEAWAGIPPAPEAGAEVAGITVISVTPLPGTGIDIDKTPSNTQTLSVTDLALGGSHSIIGALGDRLGSVSINDNLDNPFQPDILIRGFEASPVLGTPQGVAVYQNGARINEAFGETVNWDLIPDIAIRRLDVLGSNPVFGLNALGGSVVVDMKTGFSDSGGDALISGGSFGRRETAAEFGVNNGILSAYLAGRALDEDGWRASSSNSLRDVYGDLGARVGRLTLDLALTLAADRLDGESATPVQELAVERALVFTSPQQNENRLAFVTLNGSYAVAPSLILQGALYYRGFRQDVVNGNTTDYVACAAAPDAGYLCQGNGLTPLSDGAGHLIPDISDGGAKPIGENDRERISSNTVGGSLQMTSTAKILGRENHLAVGASLDSATTDFSSSAEVGVIDPALRVMSSGLFVDTPEDTSFNATPVNLRAASTFVGVYATDTFNLTPRLAVTASGRYNHARIGLTDRIGDNLNGDNHYERFNPALGATYRFGRGLTVYAGYSEGSRVPNASEIECSNPLIPCLLPSSLASDPPTLKQVVSRTWEAGLRGHFAMAGGGLAWSAGYFRTDVHNDIYAVSTSLSAGYFQNIGGTRREGVELSARYAGPRLSAYASYSYIEATFLSAFDLPSASNPFQDASGDIHVRPGDSLPGIPQHRLKIGADYEVRRGWKAGVGLAWLSDQFYRGDESNQLAPLAGHAVINLHSTLNLTRRISLFATVDNALNVRYATFGVLGDPTGVGAPGVPADGVGVNPRFQSPAAPISAHGGVKMTF
jgi:iron complex outermembrane receptor protein